MTRTIRPRGLALLLACAALAGCGDDVARVARAAPTDFADSAPRGLGTPRPTPVVTRFDGAYAGVLVPDPRNPLTCGPDLSPVARRMLVVAGHAAFGTNVPFAGTVQPDGRLVLRYLHVGTITGQFDDAAFAGVVRLGPSECRWALGLARTERPRTHPDARLSPAPGLVPMADPAAAAGLPGDPLAGPPAAPTGVCTPTATGTCR